TFEGATTSLITWDADPDALAFSMGLALWKLTGDLQGIQVAPGLTSNAFAAVFQTQSAEPTMTADGTGLTGTGAGVSVATITAGGAGTNAVQAITFEGTITGGSFTLPFNGARTTAIPWSSDPATLAANIQSTLQLLVPPDIEPGQSSGTFTATFPGPG